MKYFVFDVTLGGYGETPEEAWENCVEGLDLDPGETPSVISEDEIEDEEDEDETNLG